MSVDLLSYREKKPNYFKMVIWRIYNSLVFPLLCNGLRQKSIHAFGGEYSGQVYRSAKIYDPKNLKAGYAVCIGPRVEIYNKAVVKIGDHVVISQDTWICTASHDISSSSMKLITKPVEIGSQVWIAAHCKILPGVKIGDGAVIAAGSVVCRDVEPWTVVGGNPAKFIKRRELKNA